MFMASSLKLNIKFMWRESYYFARLLLQDTIKTQLLDPKLVQESDYDGSPKAKNTQQHTYKSKRHVWTSACLPSIWIPTIDLPPQRVHCRPYACSNFWVKKKFVTEPKRAKPMVIPKAIASSLSLNQKAVMRSCKTEQDAENGATGPPRRCWEGNVSGFLPTTDPVPAPSNSRPVSISGNR